MNPLTTAQEEKHGFWPSHNFTDTGIETGETTFPFPPDNTAELGQKRFPDSGTSGLCKLNILSTDFFR